jgi:hypothetical protein
MITVNALINQAFQRCSLVGDGQAATGTQAMNALFDLQSLIAELNGQNLILSDVETVNVASNGVIRIMEELPEGWEEVDELPEASAQLVGKVRKCGNKVYGCSAIPGTYNFQWIERPDIKWPDLLIKPLPDRVVTLSRKLGIRYIQLFPGERQLLDAKAKMGRPTFFTCETQLEKHKVENVEYNYEVFIIETDSIQSLEYRITYLKTIPQYKLNDKLYFSEKILSILEDGLCAKLCLRYKMLEVKAIFDEEFANAVRLLKRINQSNRPMTYEGIGGSYLDSYYNGFAPNNW